MKIKSISSLFLSALAGIFIVGCSNDDSSSNNTDPQPETSRWITVAGSKMGTTAGDGNGGTVLYTVTKEQAADPNFEITPFSVEANRGGFGVKSSRTARLQSTQNGRYIVNVQYGGTDGGQVDKYAVQGGGNFTISSGSNISQQVGTSPRWVKLFDGDKAGVAVNVTTPTANNAANPELPYEYTVGEATILSFSLENLGILDYNSTGYKLRLSPEEEIQGHHIFRLDSPVLNKAGNKLLIGTWMRKVDLATGNPAAEGTFERLGSKTVIVDYPSLKNPKIITSTQGHGDTSGYRSFNAFLADDGAVYQATQRDVNGSKILKIGADNEYDNTYVLSLDDALGVKNSYVNAWRYVGNGIAYAIYSHEGSSYDQIARLDLFAKTAEVVNLPYKKGIDLFQYQGFVVDGDDVYITFAPIGENGNIYVINSKTKEVKTGAKLINQPGNNFIGIF